MNKKNRSRDWMSVKGYIVKCNVEIRCSHNWLLQWIAWWDVLDLDNLSFLLFPLFVTQSSELDCPHCRGINVLNELAPNIQQHECLHVALSVVATFQVFWGCCGPPEHIADGQVKSETLRKSLVKRTACTIIRCSLIQLSQNKTCLHKQFAQTLSASYWKGKGGQFAQQFWNCSCTLCRYLDGCSWRWASPSRIELAVLSGQNQPTPLMHVLAHWCILCVCVKSPSQAWSRHTLWIGAKGIGVKFPSFSVNCGCLIASFGPPPPSPEFTEFASCPREGKGKGPQTRILVNPGCLMEIYTENQLSQFLGGIYGWAREIGTIRQIGVFTGKRCIF